MAAHVAVLGFDEKAGLMLELPVEPKGQRELRSVFLVSPKDMDHVYCPGRALIHSILCPHSLIWRFYR